MHSALNPFHSPPHHHSNEREIDVFRAASDGIDLTWNGARGHSLPLHQLHYGANRMIEGDAFGGTEQWFFSRETATGIFRKDRELTAY